jgi:uncharacterized membrane protein (GlpM family)
MDQYIQIVDVYFKEYYSFGQLPLMTIFSLITTFIMADGIHAVSNHRK